MRRLICAMFCVVFMIAWSARADGPTTLPAPPVVYLAKLLLDAGDGMPTKEAYNDYYDKGGLSAAQWSEALYFRGRQFEISDDKDKAIDLYQHVIKQNYTDLFTYTLACDALHKMGQQTELAKVPATEPVKKQE